MGKPLTSLILSCVLAAHAATALAQDFSKDYLSRMLRKVGVHVNVGVREPSDSGVTKGLTKGVSVGLAPGRTNGWKFPVGLSWYSEDLNGPSGNEFATLSMRGVYAGVGYGWHLGSRFNTSLAMQVGYSQNRVNRAGSGGAFTSGDPISIDVSNSVVLRPRWQTEYFMTKKVTFRTAVNYIISNPDIVVTTPAGREQGKWRANALNATVGLGFYPFRR
jgi:hypothetical protein